jgi:hypothetical protein
VSAQPLRHPTLADNGHIVSAYTVWANGFRPMFGGTEPLTWNFIRDMEDEIQLVFPESAPQASTALLAKLASAVGRNDPLPPKRARDEPGHDTACDVQSTPPPPPPPPNGPIVPQAPRKPGYARIFNNESLQSSSFTVDRSVAMKFFHFPRTPSVHSMKVIFVLSHPNSMGDYTEIPGTLRDLSQTLMFEHGQERDLVEVTVETPHTFRSLSITPGRLIFEPLSGYKIVSDNVQIPHILVKAGPGATIPVITFDAQFRTLLRAVCQDALCGILSQRDFHRAVDIVTPAPAGLYALFGILAQCASPRSDAMASVISPLMKMVLDRVLISEDHSRLDVFLTQLIPWLSWTPSTQDPTNCFYRALDTLLNEYIVDMGYHLRVANYMYLNLIPVFPYSMAHMILDTVKTLPPDSTANDVRPVSMMFSEFLFFLTNPHTTRGSLHTMPADIYVALATTFTSRVHDAGFVLLLYTILEALLNVGPRTMLCVDDAHLKLFLACVTETCTLHVKKFTRILKMLNLAADHHFVNSLFGF